MTEEYQWEVNGLLFDTYEEAAEQVQRLIRDERETVLMHKVPVKNVPAKRIYPIDESYIPPDAA